MIQSIKTEVFVVGDEKELCLDYSEEDDMVYVYLDNAHLFTMDYTGNLRKLARKR